MRSSAISAREERRLGRLSPDEKDHTNLDSIDSRLQCSKTNSRIAIFVTADTILIQDSEPIATTIEDTIVLLSIRAGAYLKLNEVGGQIWNMLDEPRRVGEILEVLAQIYDAEPGTMRHDVCAFLDTLIERQLIRVLNADDTR